MASHSNEVDPTTTTMTDTGHSSISGSHPLHTTPDESDQQRAELELRLKETVNSLLDIGLSVYDFQPGTDALLRQRMNELVLQYRHLGELGQGLDLLIPEEVIRYVEDGRNPLLFSREFAERTAAENQFANGRMQAFETFGQQLLEELGSVLPDSTLQTYQTQHQQSDIHRPAMS